MLKLLRQRTLASLVSLIGLIVLVFFLSRLTGDPTALFLPIDATQEMRDQFRQIHGLNDPLMLQFGRYLGDLAASQFRQSIRKARPAIDVVLEAFVWTLQLALITMALVMVGRDRGRVARGLPHRRRLRPPRLYRLADRRGGARFLDRDRRHRLLRRSTSAGCPPPAPARRGTGSCRSPCCSSGLSA